MRKLFYPLLVFIVFSFITISCMKEANNVVNPEPQAVSIPEKSDIFTQEEIDLIMAGDENTAMRIYKTNNYSDSLLLRTSSINIGTDTTYDATLKRLLKRMLKAMISAGGVGIAAPQVGILRKVIWVKRYDKTGQPNEAYINPRILTYSERKINFNGDGCLSVPNLSGKTQRSSSILLEYYTPGGIYKQEVIDGYTTNNFTAVIFQHEIDHLNGILFIDRIVSKSAKAIREIFAEKQLLM